MSDNDSKDPKDLQEPGGSSGNEPFADPFGSDGGDTNDPFGGSGGMESQFEPAADPFGDADPFGLTASEGEPSIPVADEIDSGPAMDVEVEFEDADPFDSFSEETAAEPEPSPAEAPGVEEKDEPESEDSDNSVLSAADLSAIGRFGRSRSSASLVQDDVFGGSSGGGRNTDASEGDRIVFYRGLLLG